jgi:hypothetical protein
MGNVSPENKEFIKKFWLFNKIKRGELPVIADSSQRTSVPVITIPSTGIFMPLLI